LYTLYSYLILDFYTKNIEWKYESEVRLINNINEANEVIPKSEKNPFDIYLFKVPADCVTRVCIGMDAEHTFENNLRQTIKNNPKLEHVQVCKAEMNPKLYKMDWK